MALFSSRFQFNERVDIRVGQCHVVNSHLVEHAGQPAVADIVAGREREDVADDLIRLDRCGSTLRVAAAGAPGLIELRGNGIFRTSTTAGVQVSLCVELNAGSAAERLPESAVTRVAGVELPVLRVASGAADGVAQVLMALVGRRAA